jgi:glucokinase
MNIAEVSVAQLRSELSDETHLSGPLFFLVDIGASNSRFGLAARRATSVYIRFVKVAVNSIVDLIAEFNRFAQIIGADICKCIVAATLNLPGPVQGPIGGPIANYKGDTPESKILNLSALPTTLCPLHHTVMLNDLEACAYGVVAAHHFKLFPQYFDLMWQGKMDATANGLAKGNCVVVAPGTGLGIAVIQYHAFSGKYTVLPLEFGHANVQSETDKRFLAAYKQDLKRGNYAPEYDDICSGRGLERLYKFIVRASRKNQQQPSHSISAKEISELARAGDPLALEAVALYHKFLMRCCSQMAIGFVPHMIVLCGDNAVHNNFFYELPNTVDTMKAHLLDHSCERYGFMSRPSMLRQSKLGNFNLLGCMYVCEGAARKESKL